MTSDIRVPVTESPEFAAVFKHRKSLVNGNHLHYVVGGCGDAVVLIHGFLQTWYMWRKVMLPLAQRYTVVAADMRGCGDSDKPDSGYDADTMADDVRNLVEELHLGPVYVVGHDMGAPVAYCYAAMYPDQTRALAYLDEPLPGFNLDHYARFTPDNPIVYWWYPFFSRDNVPELLIAGKEREFFDWFTGQGNMLADPGAVTERDKDVYLRSFAGAGGVRGALGWYRAIFETGHQIQEHAKTKLSMPVLGVNGEFGQPEVAEQMTNLAEDVTGGAIAGSGHFVAEEKPAEVLDELYALFAKAEAVRGDGR